TPRGLSRSVPLLLRPAFPDWRLRTQYWSSVGTMRSAETPWRYVPNVMPEVLSEKALLSLAVSPRRSQWLLAAAHSTYESGLISPIPTVPLRRRFRRGRRRRLRQ